MRAEGVDEPYRAIGGAEGDQILTEDADANRRAVRLRELLA
jgi:hypothetical protein